MRPLGEYLAAQGITVSAPLLRGHGTDPAEINDCRWQDWVADCENAVRHLKAECRNVFVAGFSLGGILALYMVEEHPELAGFIGYSPAVILRRAKKLPLLGVVKHFIRFFPKSRKTDLANPEAAKLGWRYNVYPSWGAHELYKVQRMARRNLARIHQPTLVFISLRDSTVDPRSGRVILGGISSADADLVTLHNSGHHVLIDVEHEQVFRRSYEFLKTHTQA
jgi:carboxylesterase